MLSHPGIQSGMVIWLLRNNRDETQPMVGRDVPKQERGRPLSIFGRKRGVGLDTMSECFARRPLETQAGCAPSALRQVRQT